MGTRMSAAQIRQFLSRERRWLTVAQESSHSSRVATATAAVATNIQQSGNSQNSGRIHSNPAETPYEFIFTTYNVLASEFLLKNYDNYRQCLSAHLEWTYRADQIVREIRYLNSDILNLQECNLHHFKTNIWPSLRKEYQMVFKKKTEDYKDGCSILFRRDKFELECSKSVEFNRPDLSPWLNRAQIGLMLKLRAKNSLNGACLVVCNTHLLYNPTRGEVKLAQLRLLLAELQKFAVDAELSPKGETDPRKLVYHPIIFAGDLNAEPHGALIDFLSEGFVSLKNCLTSNIGRQPSGRSNKVIKPEDILIGGMTSDTLFTADNDNDSQNVANFEIRHIFPFATVYPLDDDEHESTFSFAAGTELGQPDHIFYTSGVEEGEEAKLSLIAYRRLLKKTAMNILGPIPNSVIPSDHLSLTAKFHLK